jgi:hypothetical protein
MIEIKKEILIERRNKNGLLKGNSSNWRTCFCSKNCFGINEPFIGSFIPHIENFLLFILKLYSSHCKSSQRLQTS